MLNKEQISKMSKNEVETLQAEFKNLVLSGMEANSIKDLFKYLIQAKKEFANEIVSKFSKEIYAYRTEIYIKGEELIIVTMSEYNDILVELKKKYTEGEGYDK